MKQTKKMLALLLAVLMLCGLPFAVHAEDTATTGESGTITLNSVKLITNSKNSSNNEGYVTVRLQFSAPINLKYGKIYLCNAYNTSGCGDQMGTDWQWATSEANITYVDGIKDDDGMSYSSTVDVKFTKLFSHSHFTSIWCMENGQHSLPDSAVIRIMDTDGVGGNGVLGADSAIGYNGERLAATQQLNGASDITWMDVEDFATIEKASFAGKTENADGSFAYAVNLTFSDYVFVKDPTNFFLDTTDKLAGGGVRATSAQAVSPINVNGVNYSKTVKMNFTVTANQMKNLNASITAGSKLVVMIGEWNNTTLGYSTTRTNGQTDAYICTDQYGRGIKLAFKSGSCECSYAEVKEITMVSAVYAGREVNRFLVDVTFSEPIKINNKNDVIMRAAVEIPGVSNDPTASNYRCPLSSFTYLNDEDNDGYATKVRLYFDSKQGQIIPEWPIGSMVVGFYEYNNEETNGYVNPLTVSGIADAPVVANYASTKMDAAYCTLDKVVASIDNTYFSGIEQALAAATEGQTVRLETNTVATQAVTLKEGVTLDLNGKTLTAEGITVFGKVADSTQGAGLVAVEAGKLFINTRQENASNTNVLPLYDDEDMGYRLFNVAVNQKNHRVSTGKVEYGVSIVFGNGTYNKKAYELLADDANAAVTLEFNLLLNNDTKLFYTVKRDTLVGYANTVMADSARYQNKVIVLAVYGIDSLDEGMTLACTPELFANAEVGGTNATVYGGAQTYQHSVNA